MNTTVKTSVTDIFTDYVKTCLFPGDFYKLDEEIWVEVLPEIADFFQQQGRTFDFTADDVPAIKSAIDSIFNKELGKGE